MPENLLQTLCEQASEERYTGPCTVFSRILNFHIGLCLREEYKSLQRSSTKLQLLKFYCDATKTST